MYHHLRGRLIEKSPTHAVIECGGVGYYVHISLSTYSDLGPDEQVLLYTHLAVREDAHTLYGFSQPNERAIFRQLISVSGVGANTARMILSSLRPEEVELAIRAENIALLQAVKGIGAKTAQRIVVDLRDKVGKDSISGAAHAGNHIAEAASALVVLGFSSQSVDKVLAGLMKDHPGASVELLIKNALKKL